MKMSRGKDEGMDLELRPLTDDELQGIAGGGDHGGPICPKCHSGNVDYDPDRKIVLKCNDCGYAYGVKQ